MRKQSERMLCGAGFWEHVDGGEIFLHGETMICGPLYVRCYDSLDDRPWSEDHAAVKEWAGEQGFRCDLLPLPWCDADSSCLVVRLFRRAHEAIFRLTF